MIHLLFSDTTRYWSRRMSLLFPAALVALMVIGIGLAFYVFDGQDGANPSFVSSMAGGESARSILEVPSLILMIMAFVIGSSFVGAEIKTGTLEHVLTWEPRRERVVASRCVAAAVHVGVTTIILAALYVAMLFGLALAFGTAGGTTSTLWVNIAIAVLRAGLACGIFAIFGIGMTLVAHSSMGAIVAFLIYAFVLEDLILLLLPWIGVWLPLRNASAFGAGADVVVISGNLFSGNPDDMNFDAHHGWVVAGGLLLGWTVASATAGMLMFRRRDMS